MLENMGTWVQATRPKTLIASASPVCLAGALSFPLSWSVFWAVMATALGIQIVCNLANDYFDGIRGADTKERKGPVRVIASGLISTRSMKRALVLTTIATLIPGCALVARGGPLFGALIAIALVLAFLYTAGPWPLAYLGLGDLFVFTFFGPVAVGCVFYLLTLKWALLPFVVGVAPGALSTVLLAINNLRDVDEDRLSGKKTVVVRFGTAFGKGEAAVCLLLALVVPLFALEVRLVAWGMAIPTLHLMKQIIQNKDPFAYNPLLGKTARLLFLFTLLFGIFWDF